MTQKQTNSKTPTHEIFHVTGDGDNERWIKIGVGWSHRDKGGLNLMMDCKPLVPGHTVVRIIKPKQEKAS